MSAIGSIGGAWLLADGDSTWTITAGTRPDEAVFSVRPEDAAVLVSGSIQPVELVITPDGAGGTGRWANLFVITEEPRTDPNIARVRVVDRRWFWSHAHVSRNFNRRRVVGSMRTEIEGSPPELRPLRPEIAYHPATLDTERGNIPWTPKRALQSVLDSCLVPERDLLKQAPGLSGLGNLATGVPIEDLELEEGGDQALARILQYIPNARLTLDRFGDVVVYTATDGTDKPLAKETGPEIVDLGSVRNISAARLRPSAINVWFRREHEIRFDWEEVPGGASRGQDDRFFDNVLPVPDRAGIEIDGEKHAQGTWVTFVEYLDALGNEPPTFMPGLISAQAWQRKLLEVMVPYRDLLTPLRHASQFDAKNDWLTRIGAIQQHWRKTFRISRRWMDRLNSLRAYLIATIHPSTGTRAPAKVWADHAWIATQRTIRSYQGDYGDAPYVTNVDSYPASGDLKDGDLAPALPQILDEDQGIVHFDFVPHITNKYHDFLPGHVTIDGGTVGPTSDIRRVDKPITFNAIGTSHKLPKLTSGYKVAMLLTGSPATYNDTRNRHLFRVTKTAQEIADVLPFGAGVEESYGPVLDVYVGPSVETARVDWRDADRQKIEQSFGIGGKADPDSISHLVVNLDDNQEGGASLDAIATAVASQTYAMLVDRFHGAKAMPLLPGAHPTGYVERVSHTIMESGGVYTQARWPEHLQQLPLLSLLPDSVRRVIMRLATMRGKEAG